jgi:hypothetical protein
VGGALIGAIKIPEEEDIVNIVSVKKDILSVFVDDFLSMRGKVEGGPHASRWLGGAHCSSAFMYPVGIRELEDVVEHEDFLWT